MDGCVLTREQLLGGCQIRSIEVPGGKVFVKDWSGVERDEFDAFLVANKESTGVVRKARALVVCLSVCDTDGNLLFPVSEVDLVNSQVAWPIITAVYEAVAKFNRLRDKDVSEAQGNLNADPSEDSGSSSRES